MAVGGIVNQLHEDNIAGVDGYGSQVHNRIVIGCPMMVLRSLGIYVIYTWRLIMTAEPSFKVPTKTKVMILLRFLGFFLLMILVGFMAQGLLGSTV